MVYRVECSDCGGVYYGETNQYLHKRMYQHTRDVRKGSTGTALAEHALKEKHTLDIVNVKIVQQEKDTKKRKFIEAVNILRDEKSINFKKDCEMVSECYFSLIRGPGRESDRGGGGGPGGGS